MASLLIIGGILLAVKYADEHNNAKNQEESLVADEHISPKASKRDKFKLRYWHTQRKSRGETQLEAPPPYSGPPMYHMLDKVDDICELDGRAVEYSLQIHELPETEHSKRDDHTMRQGLPELSENGIPRCTASL